LQDLSLPRTMVQRLAKGVLPANTQIQKDALLAMSKSATVFVNYLSASANENALRSNKKTIQPRDVFDAVHDLEFDAFLPRLEAEL
ncbi:histone-fold-containing protein, partial [Rhizodiscina lignyota]